MLSQLAIYRDIFRTSCKFEWADVRAVFSPARGWGARRRFAPRRTVRPRDLVGLHSPASSGWRSTRETVVEALDPRAGRWSDGSARRAGALHGGTETGPVSEEFATLAGEGRRSRFSGPPFRPGSCPSRPSRRLR